MVRPVLTGRWDRGVQMGRPGKMENKDRWVSRAPEVKRDPMVCPVPMGSKVRAASRGYPENRVRLARGGCKVCRESQAPWVNRARVVPLAPLVHKATRV